MPISAYIRSSLRHYWRTNLAVALGVAVTVAVLAGALLVGDSVRMSLRDLFLLRLGNTSYVIAASNFFPATLADRLQSESGFGAAFRATTPLITLEGLVTHEQSQRRGSGIQIYGVDSRFWQFHGRATTTEGSALLISASLAQEFEAAAGDTLLVRVQRPSDVPVDSLHGRKENLGRTMRLNIGAILTAQELGEFALRPQQGAVRAVFVPLERIQQDLQQQGKVNAILISDLEPAAGTKEKLEALLRATISAADLGLTFRAQDNGRTLILESDKILVEDGVAETARSVASKQGIETASVFSYLANTIRIGKREIPYSMITAMDPVPAARPANWEDPAHPPIWLNQWAASDLRAKIGDTVSIEYYLWEDGGQLLTESADLTLAGILPMRGLATGTSLAPNYPGVTDAATMADWDPPFPINLKRVRPKDEAYWNRYRSAPKAFLPLTTGQRLWRSRYGQLTSLRFTASGNAAPSGIFETFRQNLQTALDPAQAGFVVYAARQEGSEASRGAVNFGEYFFYFSFFLVVSAVLLAGLFFKLGVEQRLKEIGLLRAIGFPQEKIVRLFLLEGLLLSVIGSAAGLLGAAGYAWFMMYGLRTWWVDAVGTTFLALHVSPLSLALGGAGGILAAILVIWWTLRELQLVSPRNLLQGSQETPQKSASKPLAALYWGIGSAAAAFVLLLTSVMEWISEVAGFFGSGTLLLIALVCFQWMWLTRGSHRQLTGTGFSGLARMGIRNATWRPGRSLLVAGLIASATFIIVAVDSFRHDDSSPVLDRKSGNGGYSLLAETLIPLAYDLNTAAGRESMNLSEEDLAVLQEVQFTSFRLRPGEDASCLNLYEPRNPKILAVPRALQESGRFAFAASLAETPEEKANPWLLLGKKFSDGALPAIADGNSMTYILHLGLGDDFVLTQHSGDPVRLRMVAALRDSIFQSEMMISEENFLRVFPREQGFRFFLLEAPPEKAGEITGLIEAGLSDSGFDIMSTNERLAIFHRVENTYLSTFQMLGGLGLLLGTVGLAAVLLRNVLERRRELALLRAVGYRPSDLSLLVLAENILLLAGGLVSGIVSALLAIAPALASRGGTLPVLSLGLILLAVLATGLAASWLAVMAVLRAPLVSVLRTE